MMVCKHCSCEIHYDTYLGAYVHSDGYRVCRNTDRNGYHLFIATPVED